MPETKCTPIKGINGNDIKGELLDSFIITGGKGKPVNSSDSSKTGVLNEGEIGCIQEEVYMCKYGSTTPSASVCPPSTESMETNDQNKRSTFQCVSGPFFKNKPIDVANRGSTKCPTNMPIK